MSLLHSRVSLPRLAPAPAAWPRSDAAARVAGPPALPHAPAVGPGFSVEPLCPAGAALHREAWAALAGRALDPNVFLHPDFVLPAVQHLAAGRRPTFALVWAPGADGTRDLVAVLPVLRRRGPLRGLATAWLHDLSALGTPLVDRERGDAALEALLDWIGRGVPGAAGLVFPSLAAEGPTAAALGRAAASGGRAVAILDAWERAVLRPGSGRAGLDALSPKNAKEMRRQRRRLSELGGLAYVRTTDREGVRGAVERFLALEASGWKGAAGTAMLCWPGQTAFTRTASRLLADRGLCRIDGLTLGGEPVAMAVILSTGTADFLWKIAYREDVARSSPGAQLVLEITAAQDGAPPIDSCAVPGHPMIDRLWRSRLPLVDLAVSVRPGQAGFRPAVAAERAARRLRAGAKRVVRMWRVRRRASAAAD